MNKKIFKRLLIATSLLSPVALITPMILTSCNDNKNSNKPDDASVISLGDFNKLLKTREVKDKDGKKIRDEFWLDVIDFHGNSFLGSNKDVKSQIREFYSGLVTNKNNVVTSLKEQGFVVTSDLDPKETSTQTIDYNLATKITFEKSADVYQKRNDSAKTLSTAFKDLHLSNIFEDGYNKPETNATGIITNWNDLTEDKFKTLLTQLNVNCKIEVNNKKFVAPTNANEASIDQAIKESAGYSIVYTFTPKDGYYWDGFANDNTKSNIPLVITLNDYVNNLNIIENYNQYNLSNLAELENDPIESTLQKNTLVFDGEITLPKYDNDANVKTELNNALGINIEDINKVGIESDKKKYDLLLDGNTKFVDFLVNDKITAMTDKKFGKLISSNTKDAIAKERLTAQLYKITKTTDTTDNSKIKTVTISILISSVNSQTTTGLTTWNPDYDWFLDFNDVQRLGINTAKFAYNLTITNDENSQSK